MWRGWRGRKGKVTPRASHSLCQWIRIICRFVTSQVEWDSATVYGRNIVLNEDSSDAWVSIRLPEVHFLKCKCTENGAASPKQHYFSLPFPLAQVSGLRYWFADPEATPVAVRELLDSMVLWHVSIAHLWQVFLDSRLMVSSEITVSSDYRERNVTPTLHPTPPLPSCPIYVLTGKNAWRGRGWNADFTVVINWVRQLVTG